MRASALAGPARGSACGKDHGGIWGGPEVGHDNRKSDPPSCTTFNRGGTAPPTKVETVTGWPLVTPSFAVAVQLRKSPVCAMPLRTASENAPLVTSRTTAPLSFH